MLTVVSHSKSSTYLIDHQDKEREYASFIWKIEFLQILTLVVIFKEIFLGICCFPRVVRPVPSSECLGWLVHSLTTMRLYCKFKFMIFYNLIDFKNVTFWTVRSPNCMTLTCLGTCCPKSKLSVNSLLSGKSGNCLESLGTVWKVWELSGKSGNYLKVWELLESDLRKQKLNKYNFCM